LVIAFALSPFLAACQSAASDCGQAPEPPPAAGQAIDLRGMLSTNRLEVINRKAASLPVGDGIRVDSAPDIGLAWVKSSFFTEGTIDADVCGRDVQSESFVGIAFHRAAAERYEAVYLRPFNFHSSSSESRRHAVQYVAMPDNGFGVLRKNAPDEFENAVSSSAVPSGWNHLRLVVANGRVRAFVGNAVEPALDVRTLQELSAGMVGLYVDNGSDGAFANLRITPRSSR
jgi:hypothetical protein